MVGTQNEEVLLRLPSGCTRAHRGRMECMGRGARSAEDAADAADAEDAEGEGRTEAVEAAVRLQRGCLLGRLLAL